ncbi:iron complex outermembrane receptor protein [Sphingobium sp. OAS761]|uniref:TonB-dependent receptor n=1 Tax=Sphingobium sp. OAS761 TaxID=2817901 RepID=UPI00209F556C|nr:TonB-dependent receptor [Sphingobium sp. OAS761]MCP1470440.1 iron complex outermembrane receptor protein [Sphingobium sp. OAS761]
MHRRHTIASRRYLRGTIFSGFAALAVATAPALAAESAPAPANRDGEALGDIIVTGEKRPQNLQATPTAISVLSGADLASRHITSLQDLTDGSVPSLRIAPFYSRSSALIVNIRGVGVLFDVNQPARDQGVGIYVDGVYMGRAQGLGTALFDIENIEVLKGPQGTLFGRNTEGGAVNITTKKPSGEFHVNGTAGIGNYGSYKTEAHIDLPAFHNISLKLDGVIAHRDAVVKNPLDGAYGFNFYDKRGVHVEALWRAAPGLTVDAAFDHSYDASTPLYQQLLAPGSNIQAALGTVQPSRADTANVGVPQQPSIGKTNGYRLTLEWQLATVLTLKSISAYRDLRQSQYDNGSAAITMSNNGGRFSDMTFSRYSLAQVHQKQASQEIDLIGEIPGLKYVAGAMWYREKVQDNAQTLPTNKFLDASGSSYTILPYDLDAQPLDRASHVTTTSIGLFGQATYTPSMLDERLHLTGGLRWTRDEKKGELFIVNGKTPTVNGVTAPRVLDAAWSRVDPMVTLAYDATDDVHLYAKWSTGYKSGGANSRSLPYLAFDPESLSVFEIGAKTEFWDRRGRLNLAAYAGAYKDIQVDFQANYEQIINGQRVYTTRTTIETINAPGTGRVRGVEADLTLAPVRGLTLSGSYAYTDPHIPPTVNPFPQGSSGTIITTPVQIYSVYTPKHAISGAVDYEHRLGDATTRFHIDANYDSGFYAAFVNPLYYGPGDARNVMQPKGEKSFIVNARLAIADIAMRDSGATLTAALWVRNLFNEQHAFYRALTVSSGTSGFFNDPRMFGGEINVRF